MATSLYLPSELVSAIATTLGNTAGLDVQVGQPDDFEAPGERPWVLIGIERDAPGDRCATGRIAHVLTLSLQVIASVSASSRFAACDLACTLKNLVTDNRWGLPAEQCDLPSTIDGLPSVLLRGEEQYPGWTVSFIQTLFLGPTLLDDPLGVPKFARTWEVSDIDDPTQYRALED